MNATLILIAVAIFVLAAAIYRGSGVKRNGQAAGRDMQRDMQELKAQQMDFAEAAINSNTEAYDRGRAGLTAAREQISALKGRIQGEAEDKSKHALADIEALSARLEENVRALRSVSVSVARRAQEGLSRRIHRLKARVLLLLAETKANDARIATMEQKLPEAEELLDEAMELMRRASHDLASEPEYRALVENLSRASREVGLCLRTHAQWTAEKMNKLLAESDRLVRRLEQDESDGTSDS